MEGDLDGLACILGRIIHRDIERCVVATDHISSRNSEVRCSSFSRNLRTIHIEIESTSLDGQTLARLIGELELGWSRVRDITGKGVGQGWQQKSY